MDSYFRFKKFRGVFSFCSFVLGIIVVFNSVFCSSGAVLPTFYVEYLCKGWSSGVVDLRHTQSGLLTGSSLGMEGQKCAIHLKPDYDSSVVLSIYQFSLEPGEELVIEDADKFKVALIGNGEFLDERKSFQSNGVMTLHYTKNETSLSNHMNFQFVFTQVHGTPCGYGEFECHNKNCISEKMLCDRHNNCGDKSDEENCGRKKMGLDGSLSDQAIVTRSKSWIWIVSIVVCGVILAIVVVVLLVILIVKIKKEPKKKPLATVASSISPQNPKQPPSRFNRVRQSCPEANKTQSIEQEQKQDTYQVPAMYPNIPSAPEYPGVDNPEFVTDE